MTNWLRSLYAHFLYLLFVSKAKISRFTLSKYLFIHSSFVSNVSLIWFIKSYESFWTKTFLASNDFNYCSANKSALYFVMFLVSWKVIYTHYSFSLLARVNITITTPNPLEFVASSTYIFQRFIVVLLGLELPLKPLFQSQGLKSIQ